MEVDGKSPLSNKTLSIPFLNTEQRFSSPLLPGVDSPPLGPQSQLLQGGLDRTSTDSPAERGPSVPGFPIRSRGRHFRTRSPRDQRGARRGSAEGERRLEGGREGADWRQGLRVDRLPRFPCNESTV